ncbi:MAG: LON peptidase substrate-binding domain-containing protein [Adhaeribacter sp.]
MARFLPLFPLNLVVFPGEKLNLHIFEPRYKQLINECYATNTTFGIPAFLNQQVGQVATEIRILHIEKTYPKGEMDIRTRGLRVVKILDFFHQAPNKFYPAGTIEEMAEDKKEDPVLKVRITECIRQLYSILGIQKLFMELPEDYRVFDIAHHLGLSTQQEYALLLLSEEAARQEFVLDHLQKVMPVILETEKLKERVRMNGHFKKEIPPAF